MYRGMISKHLNHYYSLGHNLGCLHDRGTSNKCDGINYNYGYRDPYATFRTILAYDCQTGQCDNIKGSYCSRIPRFSNNIYKYYNKPLGSATEDNARKINNVIEEVASFYPHVYNCKDTSLRFRSTNKGKQISTYCTWVAEKYTPYRCRLDGVSSMCPATCGTCNIRIDGTARFRLNYNGVNITRSCKWVAKKRTAEKCLLDGVSNACRVTCGS